MRSGDAPENWQKRSNKPADPEPPKPPGLVARIATFLLFVLFIAAGIGAYVVIGRESTLAPTLPMPKALKTVSPAHEDLLLYGRELNEVAVEAGARFKSVGRQNAPVARRLLDRLGRLHKTGRELEPKLTREETRALVAYQQGEKLLQGYIESSVKQDGSFDPGDLRMARAQIAHATEMARGKSLDDIVASKVRAVSGAASDVRRTNPTKVIDDVRGAGENLRLGEGE